MKSRPAKETEFMQYFWDHLSFDLPAFFMTFAAMYLSWRVYVTSTFHRVRLCYFSAGYSESAEHCGPSMTVQLKNVGLPIHNLRVAFQYVREGKGEMSYFMNGPSESESVDVFEKGMSVEMKWEPNVERWLEQWVPSFNEVSIPNPRKQCAAIVVYSGDFEVKRMFLVSRWNPVIECWNGLASKLNSLFDTELPNSDFGVPMVKSATILPTLGHGARFPLSCFGEQFSQESFERYRERHQENRERVRNMMRVR